MKRTRRSTERHQRKPGRLSAHLHAHLGTDESLSPPCRPSLLNGNLPEDLLLVFVLRVVNPVIGRLLVLLCVIWTWLSPQVTSGGVLKWNLWCHFGRSLRFTKFILYICGFKCFLEILASSPNLGQTRIAYWWKAGCVGQLVFREKFNRHSLFWTSPVGGFVSKWLHAFLWLEVGLSSSGHFSWSP